MDCLLEIAENPSENYNQNMVGKVIKTIADLTKNTTAAKEIIKQDKVKKIIAIYDKFSTTNGVAASGLTFL